MSSHQISYLYTATKSLKLSAQWTFFAMMDMIRNKEQLAVLKLATTIVELFFVTTIAAAPLPVTQRTFSNQVGYNVCAWRQVTYITNNFAIPQQNVPLTVQTHQSIHARAGKSAVRYLLIKVLNYNCILIYRCLQSVNITIMQQCNMQGECWWIPHVLLISNNIYMCRQSCTTPCINVNTLRGLPLQRLKILSHLAIHHSLMRYGD